MPFSNNSSSGYSCLCAIAHHLFSYTGNWRLRDKILELQKNSITHTPILQPVFKLSNLSQAVSQHLCCNWKDKALWHEQERFAAKGSAVLNHSLGTRGCGLKSIPFRTENIHPSKIVTSTQGLILEGNTLQEQPSVFSFLLLLTNNW